MNRFNIGKQDDGTWLFEKDGINLIVDGYEVKDKKHWMKNPEHAICYFNFNGHLYGIANQFNIHKTIEDFYAIMKTQYDIFRATNKKKIEAIVKSQKPDLRSQQNLS